MSALRNFRTRVRENRRITEGVGAAVFLALRRRICRDADHVFNGMRAGGFPFVARYRDWLAVQEVLFDEEYAIVRSVLQEVVRPRVIDGGANIGMFSLFVFREFPDACIHAYEPGSGAFAVLARNRQLNPGLDWTLHQAAMWEREETVSFVSADWSTSSRVGDSGGESESVDAVPLESVVSGMGGPVDLMKVDIEGAEEKFLCRSPELLKEVQHLLVEIHPAECDAEAVVAALRDRWCNLYEIPGRRSAKPLLLATDGMFELPVHAGIEAAEQWGRHSAAMRRVSGAAGTAHR